MGRHGAVHKRNLVSEGGLATSLSTMAPILDDDFCVVQQLVEDRRSGSALIDSSGTALRVLINDAGDRDWAPVT